MTGWRSFKVTSAWWATLDAPTRRRWLRDGRVGNSHIMGKTAGEAYAMMRRSPWPESRTAAAEFRRAAEAAHRSGSDGAALRRATRLLAREGAAASSSEPAAARAALIDLADTHLASASASPLSDRVTATRRALELLRAAAQL